MLHARSVVLGLAFLGLGAASARAEDPAPGAPASAAEVAVPWVRNWEAAKAQAVKEGKDLLIDFTGSDWCGWCVKLESEVFSQAAFLEKATQQFVFVFLDYPHGAEKQKEVVDKELNERLAEEYAVQGFPTIVLADAKGLPYAKTGYEPGGPEGYLQHLAELRVKGDKVKGLLAKGKQDYEAFKAGWDVLVEEQLLTHAAYGWVIDQAEVHDADGSKGLKGAAASARNQQKAEAEARGLMKLAKGKTPDTMPWAQVKDYLLASKFLSGGMLFNASMAVGNWLLSEKKDPVEAKKLFQLPLRDPEIASNEQAKSIIEERVKACDEALAPKEAPKDAPGDAPKDGGSK